MAIFHSYVKLPEGSSFILGVSPPFVGGQIPCWGCLNHRGFLGSAPASFWRDHQYSWTSHEYAQCILIIYTLSYHFCWLIVLIFHELFQLISYLTNIPWIFAFISHSRRNIISSPWYPSLKRRFYMALEHCWFRCCPLGPPGRPGTTATTGPKMGPISMADQKSGFNGEFSLW